MLFSDQIHQDFLMIKNFLVYVDHFRWTWIWVIFM